MNIERGEVLACLAAADGGSVTIRVHVQPRASRCSVLGLHDGCLKIAVTSPPVDGKANGAVAGFLAKILAVPRRQVILASGHSSRRKVFLVTGKSMEAIREHLESLLEK